MKSFFLLRVSAYFRRVIFRLLYIVFEKAPTFPLTIKNYLYRCTDLRVADRQPHIDLIKQKAIPHAATAAAEQPWLAGN